jgi:hypothetical protein
MNSTEGRVYTACRLLLSGRQLPGKGSGKGDATYSRALHNARNHPNARLTFITKAAFGECALGDLKNVKGKRLCMFVYLCQVKIEYRISTNLSL